MGVVEGHGPACAMVPASPTVFVHALGVGMGWPKVAVSMGVDYIVLTKDARQRTPDLRIVENAADRRHTR